MSSKFYKGNNSQPFKSMLKEYDRIIGLQNRENTTWRVIAVFSAAAFFLSLAVVFYAVNLPKTIPLVISVSEFGEAKYVGNVSKISYSSIKVPDIAIQYQVKRFITNMNTIASDPSVMRQNIKDCYNMLSGSSSNKFTKILKEDNPFEKFGSVKSNVLIESILQLSQQSYQVDYIQTIIPVAGNSTERIRFRAIISIVLLEPPEDKKIENPLGIYISDFDITKVNTITN